MKPTIKKKNDTKKILEQCLAKPCTFSSSSPLKKGKPCHLSWCGYQDSW